MNPELYFLNSSTLHFSFLENQLSADNVNKQNYETEILCIVFWEIKSWKVWIKKTSEEWRPPKSKGPPMLMEYSTLMESPMLFRLIITDDEEDKTDDSFADDVISRICRYIWEWYVHNTRSYSICKENGVFRLGNGIPSVVFNSKGFGIWRWHSGPEN